MCPRARSFVRAEIHRKQTVSETVEKAHATLPPVLDALFTRIQAEEPVERRDAVLAFARAFLRRIPDEDLEELGTDHLFAMTRSAFAFTDSRGNHPSAVRVFVPTLEEHGYICAGTILETNTDDSPFLVDSVSEELAARELRVRFLIHPVVGTARDEDGHLERVMSGRDASHRESVMHVEIERHLSDAERADLEVKVRDILHDVRLVVRDFEPMQDRVTHMMELARHATVRYSPQEVGETVDFLDWLLQLNFVLLGYREYDLLDTPEGRAIQATPASGLGILSDIGRSTFAAPTPLASLPEHVRSRIEDGDLLVNAKTSAYSTVHRRAPMDYIGVRKVSPDGAIVGEARLLGLFTSKAYMEPAAKTPLLHHKLEQIIAAEDLIPGSHDYKEVVELFESFPKDELFQGTAEELRQPRRRPAAAGGEGRDPRAGPQGPVRATGLGRRRAAPRALQRVAPQAAAGHVPRTLPRHGRRLPPVARRDGVGEDLLHGPRRAGRADPGDPLRGARGRGRTPRADLGRRPPRRPPGPLRRGARRGAREDLRGALPRLLQDRRHGLGPRGRGRHQPRGAQRVLGRVRGRHRERGGRRATDAGPSLQDRRQGRPLRLHAPARVARPPRGRGGAGPSARARAACTSTTSGCSTPAAPSWISRPRHGWCARRSARCGAARPRSIR